MLTSLLAPKGSRSAKPLVEDMTMGMLTAMSPNLETGMLDEDEQWLSFVSTPTLLVAFQKLAVRVWKGRRKRMKMIGTGRWSRRCSWSALRSSSVASRDTGLGIRGQGSSPDWR